VRPAARSRDSVIARPAPLVIVDKVMHRPWFSASQLGFSAWFRVSDFSAWFLSLVSQLGLGFRVSQLGFSAWFLSLV
jgi:hypothetical protein